VALVRKGTILTERPPLFGEISADFQIVYNISQNSCGLFDDVNLMGDNVDTMKKNTQTLIDASKEIGLEVNTEKS
jgi:hypothetical protein